MTSIQLKKEIANIKRAEKELTSDKGKARQFLRTIGLADKSSHHRTAFKRK